MRTPSVRFHYPILCDDVRREDNGKLIFIGVYGPTIKVKELPTALLLRLVIPVSARESLDANFELRVKYGKMTVFHASGTARIEGPADSILSAPPIILDHLDHPDTLSFMARLDKGRWQTVRSISFEHISD